MRRRRRDQRESTGVVRVVVLLGVCSAAGILVGYLVAAVIVLWNHEQGVAASSIPLLGGLLGFLAGLVAGILLEVLVAAWVRDRNLARARRYSHRRASEVSTQPTSLRTSILLWAGALAVTLLVAAWQLATGPKWPVRTGCRVGAEGYCRVELPRSAVTGAPARAVIWGLGSDSSVTLRWRPFPPGDTEYKDVRLRRGEGVTEIPSQPPGGRVEYHMVHRTYGHDPKTDRLPASPGRDPILRFRAPVSVVVQAAHILLVLFAVLLGVRAALAVLLRRPEDLRLASATLISLSAGGLVLGGVLQHEAYGVCWRGWPVGNDRTSTLVFAACVLWALAAVALRLQGVLRPGLTRAWTLLALLALLAAALIPHTVLGA